MRRQHGKSTRRYRPPASRLTYRMAGKLYKQVGHFPEGAHCSSSGHVPAAGISNTSWWRTSLTLPKRSSVIPSHPYVKYVPSRKRRRKRLFPGKTGLPRPFTMPSTKCSTIRRCPKRDLLTAYEPFGYTL